MRNILTNPPLQPINDFSGFTGDLSHIVERILSSSLPSVPYKHSPESGLLTNMAVDIGQCSLGVYYSYLQNRYTAQQDRLLRPFVGKRGDLISDLSTSEAEYFDGTVGDLRTLTDEEKAATIERILGYYWLKLRENEGQWISTISPKLQTIALSWMYDYAEKNARKYSELMKILRTGDFMQLSSHLANISDSSPSLHWRTNRLRDILYLIQDRIELSNDVGDGMTNDSQDVANLETRLVELGFNPLSNGSDFSSLVRFSTYLGLTNTSVEPGDRIHIWLASRNAPSNILLVSVHESLEILPTNEYVCSWLFEMLNSSGRRLEKLNQVLRMINDSASSSKIIVDVVNDDGMSVEIKLPSTDVGQDAEFTGGSLYDQDGMKLILESLLADERIHDAAQLKLNDAALAAKGLCQLVGERRLDPQAGSSAQFRQDFISDSDWMAASPSPDRLHVMIYSDELSDNPDISNRASRTTPLSFASTSENMAEISTEIEMNTSVLSAEEELQLEDYESAYGPAWAPEDATEKTQYYLQALRGISPQTYPDLISGQQLDFVPDPLPVGVPYLMGITDWLLDRRFMDGWNVYGDTIILIWNDGSTNQLRTYRASTRPGKVAGYNNIRGDAHLLPGRYQFEMTTKQGNQFLIQHDEVSVGRDIEKEGTLPSTSVPEDGDFNIAIKPGKEGTTVRRSSRGSQVLYGGDDVGSPWEEFSDILVNQLGYADGDLILYSLIDGSEMQYPTSTGGGS